MKSFSLKIITLSAWAVVLTGCEVPTASIVESDHLSGADLYTESFASEDLTTVLVEELDMSTDQQTALHVEMERHDRPEKTPGSLWFVSARLEGFLTLRQKEKLFELGKRHGQKHLRKLVGVYHPCVIDRPVDHEWPERLPVRFVVDVLTDEQLEAAEEIRERYRAAIVEIREQLRAGEITREEATRLVKELHDALEQEVRDLLTEDQIAALRERLAARGDKLEEHKANSRRAMIAALDLSDGQVRALDDLHREQCSVLEELARLAHDGEITREEFRSGLERLIAAKYEAYGVILGREQYVTAKIHDVLLVIHARRFIRHITDHRRDDRTHDDPNSDGDSSGD